VSSIFVGCEPMKIRAAVFVGLASRRKYYHHFRRLDWPTKIGSHPRRLCRPTKTVLFSSVAGEKTLIFVDFISSADRRK
jgi:hypothetical protein